MKLRDFATGQSTGLSTVVTPISLEAGAGSVQPAPAPTASFHLFLPVPRVSRKYYQ
jgi:hypothetical protein